MEWSKDAAAARRRMQNRLAQRRFRWKQNRNRKKTSPVDSQANPRPASRMLDAGDAAGPRALPDREPLSLFPAHPGGSDQSEAELLDQERIVDKSGASPSNLYDGLVQSDFAMCDFSIPPPAESAFTCTWLPTDNDGIEGLDSPLLTQPEQIRSKASENGIDSTVLQVPTPDPSSSLSAGGSTSVVATQTWTQAFLPTPGSASTTSLRDETLPTHGYGSAVPCVQAAQDSKTSWFNPLHSAAARGHARIVHILLEHQPGESDYCNAPDSYGLTPLAHAIAGAFEDVISSLLLHGARLTDVALGSHGKLSALHWAVLKRQEASLRILLEHKDSNADNVDFVNVADAVGRSPLHLAVQLDFEAGVLLLLKHGADLNSRALRI
ncbi:ankyrin repeat-containing domain protein [Nemania abortiva]|nr:ankyrin repeat-containing domain protein [Nemania abortiva]